MNCTDVQTVESPDDPLVLDDNRYDDQAIYNLTTSVNSTDGKLDVSEITAEEVSVYEISDSGITILIIKSFFPIQTLSSSELSKLDPNETSTDEIRQAFCRDIARVARSYEVR